MSQSKSDVSASESDLESCIEDSDEEVIELGIEEDTKSVTKPKLSSDDEELLRNFHKYLRNDLQLSKVLAGVHKKRMVEIFNNRETYGFENVRQLNGLRVQKKISTRGKPYTTSLDLFCTFINKTGKKNKNITSKSSTLKDKLKSSIGELIDLLLQNQ